MFIVALLLFVGGIYVLGISFSLPDFQALVFIGGLLLVTLGVAIPVHFGSATRRNTWKS